MDLSLHYVRHLNSDAVGVAVNELQGSFSICLRLLFQMGHDGCPHGNRQIGWDIGGDGAVEHRGHHLPHRGDVRCAAHHQNPLDGLGSGFGGSQGRFQALAGTGQKMGAGSDKLVSGNVHFQIEGDAIPRAKEGNHDGKPFLFRKGDLARLCFFFEFAQIARGDFHIGALLSFKLAHRQVD